MQAQGKKKQIPIFGYFRVFKEYPQKSQIWKCETSPNQGTLLGIPWLGLVLLCQIWDFYEYSLNTLKYPKVWNLLFFPVSKILCFVALVYKSHFLQNSCFMEIIGH